MTSQLSTCGKEQSAWFMSRLLVHYSGQASSLIQHFFFYSGLLTNAVYFLHCELQSLLEVVVGPSNEPPVYFAFKENPVCGNTFSLAVLANEVFMVYLFTGIHQCENEWWEVLKRHGHPD